MITLGRFATAMVVGIGLAGCTTTDTLPSTPAVASSGSLDLDGPVLPALEVDVRPVAVRQGPPVYPYHLRAAGVQGETVTEFIVEKDGSVSNVLALRATEDEFGQAAEACIRGWRFRPAKKHGVPVRCRMQVPIVFSLNP